MTAFGRLAKGLRCFASDVAQGFFEITHNGFALVGLATVCLVLTLSVRPDLRANGESRLRDWLQSRQEAAVGMPIQLDAIERATATDPKELPKQQAAVAYWLSKKYRVAPEPVAALVAEAYEFGEKNKVDPTLILAVMAIESGFNPFAQSPVGAQGLMQVMTGVHKEKYEHFGGRLAAFDPVTNLRVGVKVLQECIQRAGSLHEGLRWYVGAGAGADDGGYADKVMAEHGRLKMVATGRAVPPAPPVIRTIAPVEPEIVPAPATPAEDKIAAIS